MAVLAPSLARGRTEINVRWPHRDHSSDGWIGDTRHQQSGSPENGGSDHNVNKRGKVDALDVDVDGINCPLVVARAIRHPAVNYVIWNRTIWSRSRGFAAHRYTGSDPHTNHIHISIMQSVAAEVNTAPWGISSIVVDPVVYPVNPGAGTWAQRLARAMPVLRKGPGVRGSVRKWQALANAGGAHIVEDGKFGDRTDAATRGYQRAWGLTVDGVVGAQTWGHKLGGMSTCRQGSKSVDVRHLQALLNVFGAGLVEDSDYGPHTAAAVRGFQAHYGLTTDSVAGPITWTALLTR